MYYRVKSSADNLGFFIFFTLAAASIRGKCVAVGGTCAVEAAWCVVATVGTDVPSSRQSTLINIWGKRMHSS